MSQQRDPQRLLRPPQFGLKFLFLAVTAVGVFLAVAQHLSPLAVGMVGFLLLSIAAHVAANALGTRLRGGRAAEELHDLIGPHPQVGATDRLAVHHPATNLSQRRSLGVTLFIAAASGLTIGAAGGAIWTLSGEQEVGWFPVFIGALAFGTLGALAAALAAGFIQSAWSAWREATAKS